MHFCEFVSQNN